MSLYASNNRSTSAERGFRVEVDALGPLEVPDDCYFGVHTARALTNFAISGVTLSNYPEFIAALATVKQAAALTNRQLGLLDAERSEAIVQACEEIRAGQLHDSFVVDVIQGGAGTSTNMNANEVIANRALEILGHRRGDYVHLHPLDHVNLSQSTNDVYPTAIKIALQNQLLGLEATLVSASAAFRAKADEFADVLKMGRTQLQDAVPMTLGREFGTYAVMLGEDVLRLIDVRALISEINLGGTAIGTGLNAPPGYAEAACRWLSEVSGLGLSVADDLIEASQDVGALVSVSSALKRVALKLSKICNDLRLLSSGPQAGLGEINLPAVQAGSSMMPGKVNPVIPETVNQVAFEVVGNDVTVSMAAEAGQLQLNAFEPIIAHSLFKSVRHLDAACGALIDNCVRGITANADRLHASVANSVGVVTVLTPAIGYAAASRIAKRALASGRPIAELVIEENLLSPDRVAELLRVESFLRPTVLPAVRQSECRST